MADLETRTYEQLAPLTAVPSNAIISVQVPGAPVMQLPYATLKAQLYEADVAYETRAELFLDLAHVAGSIGYVWGDPAPGNKGYYQKSGAEGAGAWTLLGVDTLALRADLADPDGWELVNTPGGDLATRFAATDANMAPLRQSRTVPHANFAWCPLIPTHVEGGYVRASETPIGWAKRTRVYTGDVQNAWGSPNGDDTTGLSTFVSPYRTGSKLLQDTFISLIRLAPGRYDAGSSLQLRADTHATQSARLRILEAQGEVRIAHRADDLSGRGCIVTFSGLPTAGQALAFNAVAFTFVAAAATWNEVTIGANAAATATNFANAVNASRPRHGVTAYADGAIVELSIPAPGQLSVATNASNVAATGCAITATGSINFAGGVPGAGEPLTIGGVPLAFRATAAVPGEITIGADANATAINAAGTINRLSSMLGVTAVASAGVVTLFATVYGAAGNAITLAEAAANVTVSGATLANGRDAWAQSGQNWRFKLTPGNKPPIGVLNLTRLHPETNYPLPNARVAATRVLTFGAQPADGDTVTANGRVATFKTAVTDANNQILIGASKEATASNMAAFVKAQYYSYGTAGRDYRGLVADMPATNQVRLMPVWGELDSAVDTVTASGAQPTIAAVVTGDTNVSNAALSNNQFGDNGYWWHDAANNELVLRRGSDKIEQIKDRFRLVTSSYTDTENRCFLLGSEVALKGRFVFEGTYISLWPYAGNRGRFYYELRGDLGPSCVFTPGTVGWLENNGSMVLGKGGHEIYTAGDAVHPTTTADPLAPQTLQWDCQNYFPGNPYGNLIIDFANRNNLSGHGADASTIAWGCTYRFAYGPSLPQQGYAWFAGVSLGDTIVRGGDVGQGVYAIDGTGRFFLDTLDIRNCEVDIDARGGAQISQFRIGYRTSNLAGGSTMVAFNPPTI